MLVFSSHISHKDCNNEHSSIMLWLIMEYDYLLYKSMHISLPEVLFSNV